MSPIYCYRCTKCGTEFEAMRSVARRGKPPACPKCTFPSKLIPSVPALQDNPGTKLRKKLDAKKPKVRADDD